MKNEQSDEKQIKKFLSHFPGYVIQFFDDDKQRRDSRLAGNIADFDFDKCQSKQKTGCGIYFSVNGFEKGRRRKKNLTKINGIFIDLDISKEEKEMNAEEKMHHKNKALTKIKKFSPKAHFVIETKNGLQAIWLVKDIKNENEFNLIQNSLIKTFDSDKGAKSIAQVLRLPGFYHLKNPKEPFKCRLILDNSQKDKYFKQDFKKILNVKNANTQKNRQQKEWENKKDYHPSKEIQQVLKMPIKQVIKKAAEFAKIKIDFKPNPGGSWQIIENNEITSGFISVRGNFVHSSSEKEREGNPITVAEYYINKIGKHNFNRQQIAKIILGNKQVDETKEIENELPFGFIPLKKFMQLDIPEQGYLVKQLLPDSGVSILVGDFGNSKTWVALHICFCILKKEKVFGIFDTKQTNIAIINTDDGKSLLKKRLQEIGLVKENNICIWQENNFFIDDRKLYTKLSSFIKEKKIGLLIFDAFRDCHNSEENSSTEMNEIMRKFKNLAKDGCAILLLHHTNKTMESFGGKTPRGSTAITASSILVMQTRKKGDCIEIKITKNKMDKIIKPFFVKFLKKNSIYTFEMMKTDKKSGQELLKKIKKQIDNKKHTKTELIEYFFKSYQGKVGKNKIKRIIETLIKDKFLLKDPKKYRYNKNFYLKNPKIKN